MSDHSLQSATTVKIAGTSIHGTYDTARGVASLFAFFGWLIVVVGIMAGVAGLSLGAPFNFLIVAVGVGIAAIGLLLVAAEQMLRASVDSADYSRQALLLQIGLAERRSEIDLGYHPAPMLSGMPRPTTSPERLRSKPSGTIEETYEYKGKRILKIGADYFVEGHDQPYNSLYTVRLIIDRGDA
jgi:hypothetical protein